MITSVHQDHKKVGPTLIISQQNQFHGWRPMSIKKRNSCLSRSISIKIIAISLSFDFFNWRSSRSKWRIEESRRLLHLRPSSTIPSLQFLLLLLLLRTMLLPPLSPHKRSELPQLIAIPLSPPRMENPPTENRPIGRDTLNLSRSVLFSSFRASSTCGSVVFSCLLV